MKVVRMKRILDHFLQMIKMHLVQETVDTGGPDCLVVVGMVNQKYTNRARQTGAGTNGKRL